MILFICIIPWVFQLDYDVYTCDINLNHVQNDAIDVYHDTNIICPFSYIVR